MNKKYSSFFTSSWRFRTGAFASGFIPATLPAAYYVATQSGDYGALPLVYVPVMPVAILSYLVLEDHIESAKKIGRKVREKFQKAALELTTSGFNTGVAASFGSVLLHKWHEADLPDIRQIMEDHGVAAVVTCAAIVSATITFFNSRKLLRQAQLRLAPR